LRTTLPEAFARLGKAAGVEVRVASHTMRYSVNAVARRVAKLDPQQRAELLNHVSTATLNVYDRLDNDAEGRVVRNASWVALKGLVDGAAGK
jgi:integrase